MSDQRDSKANRFETISGFPTINDLIIAVIVVVMAVIGSLLAGPGFGLLVLTLALLAAGLWIAYASAPPIATDDTPARPVAVRQKDHQTPSWVRRPTLARVRDLSLDRATFFEYGPAILLIGVIFFGFYARNLRTNPPSLFSDEAMIGLQASGALNGDANFQFGRIFYTHFDTPLLGALPVYATWPFVTLFGLNEFGVRIASAFYTALGLYFAFLALRRLRVPFPLLPILIVGTQPIVIHLARINFGHTPSFFLLMVASWLWIRGRQDENIRLAVLGGFLAGVASYGHLSFVVAVPLFVFAICISELIFNRANWRSYRAVVGFGAAAVVAMLPHAWLALADPRYWDRLEEKQGGGITPGVLADRFSAYPHYFSLDYLFRKGEDWYIFRHSIPGAGEMYQYMLVALVVGIVSVFALWRHPQTRFLFPFVLVALAYPIPDAISHPPSNLPYSFATYWGIISLPFLVGAAVLGVQALLAKIDRPVVLRPLAVATAVLALAFGIWFYRGPMTNYPLISADYWGWQFGPKPILEYFKAHADEYDDLLMSGDFNGAWVFPQFWLHGTPLVDRARLGGPGDIDLSRNQLIALKLDDWKRYQGSQFPAKSYLTLVAQIDYPNGEPAVYLLTVDPRYRTGVAPEIEEPAG